MRFGASFVGLSLWQLLKTTFYMAKMLWFMRGSHLEISRLNLAAAAHKKKKKIKIVISQMIIFLDVWIYINYGSCVCVCPCVPKRMT